MWGSRYVIYVRFWCWYIRSDTCGAVAQEASSYTLNPTIDTVDWGCDLLAGICGASKVGVSILKRGWVVYASGFRVRALHFGGFGV